MTSKTLDAGIEGDGLGGVELGSCREVGCGVEGSVVWMTKTDDNRVVWWSRRTMGVLCLRGDVSLATQ